MLNAFATNTHYSSTITKKKKNRTKRLDTADRLRILTIIGGQMANICILANLLCIYLLPKWDGSHGWFGTPVSFSNASFTCVFFLFYFFLRAPFLSLSINFSLDERVVWLIDISRIDKHIISSLTSTAKRTDLKCEVDVGAFYLSYYLPVIDQVLVEEWVMTCTIEIILILNLEIQSFVNLNIY